MQRQRPVFRTFWADGDRLLLKTQEGERMNKVFGRVWSKGKQMMVVTSELASAGGQKRRRRHRADVAPGAAVLLFGCASLWVTPAAHAAESIVERNGANGTQQRT